jgi:hypothetical protein
VEGEVILSGRWSSTNENRAEASLFFHFVERWTRWRAIFESRTRFLSQLFPSHALPTRNKRPSFSHPTKLTSRHASCLVRFLRFASFVSQIGKRQQREKELLRSGSCEGGMLGARLLLSSPSLCVAECAFAFARAFFLLPSSRPLVLRLPARCPRTVSIAPVGRPAQHHHPSTASLLSARPPTSPRSPSSVRIDGTATTARRYILGLPEGAQKGRRYRGGQHRGGSGKRELEGTAKRCWESQSGVALAGEGAVQAEHWQPTVQIYRLRRADLFLFPPSTAVSSPPHLSQHLTALSYSRSPILTPLPNDTSVAQLSLMPPPKKRPAVSLPKGDPITGLDIRLRKSSSRGHTSTGGGGKGKGKAKEGGLTSYHTFVRPFLFAVLSKEQCLTPARRCRASPATTTRALTASGR